jgi:hypothetical protein
VRVGGPEHGQHRVPGPRGVRRHLRHLRHHLRLHPRHLRRHVPAERGAGRLGRS